MAITIKHAKTDTIADWTQADLDAQIALGNFPPGTTLADIVLPSDWNNDHTFTGTLGVSNGGTGATTLTGYVKGNGTSAFTASSTIPNTDITGLGTMATQNASSVSITGGSISGTTVSGYIPTTEKGVANGVATLDSGGKVPVSQIPALGDLNYQGTWNASTNTPTLTSSVGTKGYYYVVNVAGSTNLNGITDWQVGDWAVYNGSIWQKIDNTDAVTSVNGYTGTVVLSYTDVGAAPATSGTSILYGNGSGGFSNVTVGSGLSFSTGTLSATGGSMVYPSAGIPNSTGTSWGTSYTTTGSGTIVALQTNPTLYNPNIDVIDFDTTYATTLTTGQLGWDGNNTLGLGMSGGNIVQQIGLQTYLYGKASSAITKGQLIKKTGANGTSGVITFAPTTANMTNAGDIIGIAAESIALNGFGYIISTGSIKGFNTTGASSGETWADGDTIYYNPTGSGLMTNVKPSAPNLKVEVGIVINASSGGSGSVTVEIIHGSTLGGTDSNVQISGTPSNGQILTYDTSNTYWKNTSLTAGTGISVSAATGGVLTVTNSAPDQTVSITGSGGAVVTGTYPNFTITTPSGTVTSVTGTAPISSTGGATPAISISQATTSTNGYLSSTDWNTFNNKQPAGSYLTTVTASSPLSGSGTAGSPLVIAQANTSTSGYLSSTDWNTFNNKGNGTVTSVTGTAPVSVATGTTTPVISMAAANGTTNGYLTSTDWTTFNNKGNGSVTSVSVVSANGLAGTVATSTTTPAITLSTTVTGIVKGNGTSLSAAVSGTDYAPATSGTSILYGNGSGGFSNVTVGSGLSFATGTLSSTVTSGVTVTNDTSTATALYPTFTNATSGSVSGVSVTSTKLNFTPSSGLLSAPIVNASNGIHVNSKTVSTSYSIPSGSSAMSAGPMTVASGVTVTIATGSRWVVL